MAKETKKKVPLGDAPIDPSHQIHAKPRPSMPSIKPTGKIDSMITKTAAQMPQEQLDLLKLVRKVFETPEGEKVLAYLDQYSCKNFPNYGESADIDGISAVLCTYSKIGEQSLVKHIKALLYKSKTIK